MGLLARHDDLLIKDLRWQPLWLIWIYIAVGLACSAAAFVLPPGAEAILVAIGGGFLLALGCEKLVTRRIRLAALATHEPS